MGRQAAPDRRPSGPSAAGRRASGADAGRGAGAVPDRVLTVPNALSVVRLLCVPVFLWLLFGLGDRLAAAVLLAVLGSTDWVDGYVARRYHQESTLGKALDPVADRLLLAVGVVAIVIDGSVPVGLATLTIVREVTVLVVALLLAARGVRRVDVTWVGKAGTFGQMVAYPLFLAGHADVPWAGVALALAWVVVVPALMVSYVAAVRYLPLVRGPRRLG